jgi:hypothetical protein
MKDSWLWGVVSLFLGLAVPVYIARQLRRVERRGEVIAMLVEIEETRARLNSYTTQNIMAPLYRLPSSNLKLALPKLIGAGPLTNREIDTLIRYANKVDEINRGLDRASDESDDCTLRREYERNCAKATEMLSTPMYPDGSVAMIDAATMAMLRMTQVYNAAKREQIPQPGLPMS